MTEQTEDLDKTISIFMMAASGIHPKLIARRLEIDESEVDRILKPVREKLSLKRQQEVY